MNVLLMVRCCNGLVPMWERGFVNAKERLRSDMGL